MQEQQKLSLSTLHSNAAQNQPPAIWGMRQTTDDEVLRLAMDGHPVATKWCEERGIDI